MQSADDQPLWISQPLEQSSQWRTQEQLPFWNPSEGTRQAEVLTQSQQYRQEPSQSQWPNPQQPYQLQPNSSPESYQWPSSSQTIPLDQQLSRIKKPHKRLWVALCIVVALIVCDSVAIYSIVTSASKSENAIATTPLVRATTAPVTISQTSVGQVLYTTAPPNMVHIQSFYGHLSDGNWYHSMYFTVPDNWQVEWICARGERSLPNVTVVGDDHSGQPIAGDDKVAAQGNCGEGFGVGAIQKHGGTIQLQIYAQGDFMVIVVASK